MKTKEKVLIIASILCAVMLIMIIILIAFLEDEDKYACEARVVYDIALAENSFYFDGKASVYPQGNNETGIYLSGVIADKYNRYEFSQYVTISSFKVRGDRYKISSHKVKQLAFDNTPSHLAELLYDVMGLTGSIQSYIYSHGDNYIVWGTLLYPTMSCVTINNRR